MSVYGNNFCKGSVNLVERYIDNCFLESSLSDINKEIKSLKNKDKITKSDIDEVYKKIESIESKTQRKEATTMFISVLTGMFTSLAGYVLSYSNVPMAIISTIAGSLMIYVPTVIADEKQNKVVDDFYYKLMKIEARAKVAKDKAEKLDDTTNSKNCQKLIDICEELKTKRRRSLRYKTLGESSVEELFVNENEDLLLEYKGNDIKNNIFIQILDDIDNICKMNMEKISTCENTISRMMTIGNSCNEKNVKDNLIKCRDIGRKTNNELSSIGKDYYGPLTFNLVKQEVNKFNNKYGSISMQEKKKLADKLNKYKKKLYDIGEKYSGSNSSYDKKLTIILDKVESSDVAAGKEFYGLVLSWIKYIINEVNYTIGDIDYILKLLDIEKIEKSIVYKALNLKSR